MVDFSSFLQNMVRSTPLPTIPTISSVNKEDRIETPKDKIKKEDNLMNTIGLAVKRGGWK